MNASPNKRLIIVAQEKGGVWKTFLAIHLIAYLRRLGKQVTPVDFDFATGHISSVYPESKSVSADALQLRDGTSNLPDMFRFILAGEECIFDCGASTGQTWDTLLNPHGGLWPGLLGELKERGIKITLVVPVARAAHSHEAFALYQQIFPEATHIMAVIRKHAGESFPLPKHPPELTIIPPIAVPALISTYEDSTLHMSLDQIRDSKDPRLGLSPGFAAAYVPQLFGTFDKIQQHLL